MVRNVRESPRYAQQRAQLGFDIKRLDEALFDFVTAVSGAAEEFAEVPGTPWRCVPLRMLGDPPGSEPLRIYLEIVSSTQVELIQIERINEDPDDPLK